MQKRLQTLLLALVLCGLLLALPVTLAQDEEPIEPAPVETEEEASPVAPGTATLFFLVGMGAVMLVGGAMWARDNFQPDENAA